MTGKRNPKKLKSVEVEDLIVNLPVEILTEIVRRLPVKSILTLRCVSKSWRSLLSSEYFIKTHLKTSKKDSSFDSYRIIMGTYKGGLKQVSVGVLLFEQTSNNHSDLYMDDLICDPTRRVVDSCNGLILLNNSSHDLFLWNPSIKKSRKLPSIDTDRFRKHVYGFGFDESNDDYKVATIVRSIKVDSVTVLKSSVYIYSLKTDCWKMFGDIEGEIVGTSIKFANSKVYWGARRSLVCSNDKWVIVSLDLESGVYEMVDQPDYREGKIHSTLGLLGGCISVYSSYKDKREALWVLKTEGSWSKVFEFNFRDLKTPIVNAVSRLVSLSMLPNGEILLAYMKCFVIYKPIDKSFKIHINERYPIYGADLYVESLVSPVANSRLQCEATSFKREEKEQSQAKVYRAQYRRVSEI